jgi:glutaryl-CoA dehydrogenase
MLPAGFLADVVRRGGARRPRPSCRPPGPSLSAIRFLAASRSNPIFPRLFPTFATHTRRAAEMAKFQGVDYYDIDALLTEEQRMIRDTVREWVDDNLLPVINEAYIGRYLPKQLVPGMAELGVFGANLPEEYGCAGLDNVSYGLIMQELERGDSGIRSFASVQGALCMYPIYAFGSEEQKREYLPRMAAGEVIGCFGLTEPDFGSNPGGMVTRARKTDDGWVLNGAKMWITNGSTANIAIVWAKTGELDDSKSVRGFIVPTDTPGFSAKDQKGKLSLLASDTSELVFQDVRLPEDAILPKSGGLKSPLMCLTQARYGIAWGAVGAAMACYDEALSYAKNRVQFGTTPIAGTQIQQTRLAEMLTEITKAQLLCWRLGNLKDQGTMRPEQVSLAKRNNVSMACEVAREARRLLGANGILVEYQAMRHMANLESVYTYEGTHDVHGLILGNDITGIAAF